MDTKMAPNAQINGDQDGVLFLFVLVEMGTTK